ncbi:hypothetical protein [Nocardia sp. NPDC049707]|uniref:hypothetical protein n=1 Tax=Nocardia sp. NPDC049707 TaxID=3154735 RepID=UPI00341AD5A9
MFDPITLAIGAGIACAGWAVGRFGRRSAAQPAGAQCGCGHDLALHDPKAGTCHAELGRKTMVGRVWVQCTCRRYTGPVPVEDFFSRTIMPLADEPMPRSGD